MLQPMFSGINHVGVVTGDIDRAVRTWADGYGIGPWRVITFRAPVLEATVAGDGAELALRIASAYVGERTRIELIQPLTEDPLYGRSLVDHDGRDHIHHLRFDVEDYEAGLAAASDRGLPTILDARFRSAGGYSSVVYLDTRQDLGFVSELASLPAGFVPPEPDYVYPAEANA